MVLKKQIVVLPTIHSRRDSKLEDNNFRQSASILTKARTLIGWKNGRIRINHRASKSSKYLLVISQVDILTYTK